MAFLAEIRPHFDGTILLAGAISTGRDILAALTMGADLAYMGTRFINTTESKAPEAYKKMIVESGSAEIVYTAAVSGVPANFLKASLEAAGISSDRWKAGKKIDFGKELDAGEAEAKAWKTIWSAGQGVVSINDVLSVQQLVATLKQEFQEAGSLQHQIVEKFN